MQYGENLSCQCKFKGSYRIKGIRNTNPIAVGDRVIFSIDNEGTGLISNIQERKNYIIRRSSNLSKETQIIATNIDLALLLITITHPVTNSGFVDRFLATAEAYSIPVHIIFNKCDLYKDKNRLKLKEWMDIYSSISYPVTAISSLNPGDIEKVKSIIKDKICLFSGNSGVGKSTLANKIQPGLNLRTSSISEAHKKGKHTTTFAEMYQMNQGGYIIDTPGIKGFGVFDMAREEISHYFKEIFRASELCQYNNCTHTHEPGCNVKILIEKGEISQQRYNNYLNILEDENDKYRKPF